MARRDGRRRARGRASNPAAMTSTIIGVTGYMRSGKDSVGQVLVEEFGFRKYAFADSLRELAARINPTLQIAGAPRAIVNELSDKAPSVFRGWDGVWRYGTVLKALGYERAKEVPDFRRFLQQLGNEARVVLGPDVWVAALEQLLEHEQPERVVITDVRYFNEAEWLQTRGVLWRIQRPGCDGDGHASEAAIDRLPADVDVYNDGTLAVLQNKIRVLASSPLRGLAGL
jgi:hypothetical protein